MRRFLLFLVCACGWAQINPPSIGMMLDQMGHAHAVTGIPAAAALGIPLFGEAVVSLGCGPSACLAKTQSALVSSGGERVEAPTGAALIAWDTAYGSTAAYVYFVATRQLAWWNAEQLFWLDFTPSGEVLSIRSTAAGFEYAVERDENVWVGGQALGQANTVLLLDDGSSVLALKDQVRLLRPDGTIRDFSIGAENVILGFLSMGDRYVEVMTAAGEWALDTEPGKEQLFLLPGASE